MLVAKDVQPLLEKKIEGEMEILISSRLQKAQEAGKGAKGGDNMLAEAISSYFKGESEVTKVVKESKAGAIEVHAEYLESSDDHDSMSSQISSASNRRRQRGRPSMANTVYAGGRRGYSN